jgi:hypothetical protein
MPVRQCTCIAAPLMAIGTTTDSERGLIASKAILTSGTPRGAAGRIHFGSRHRIFLPVCIVSHRCPGTEIQTRHRRHHAGFIGKQRNNVGLEKRGKAISNCRRRFRYHPGRHPALRRQEHSRPSATGARCGCRASGRESMGHQRSRIQRSARR